MGEGVGWEGFASIERGFRGQRVGRGEDWDHVSGSPGSGAIGETGSQAQAKPRGGPTLCERLEACVEFWAIVVGNRESCDRGKENKRWGMSGGGGPNDKRAILICCKHEDDTLRSKEQESKIRRSSQGTANRGSPSSLEAGASYAIDSEKTSAGGYFAATSIYRGG